MLFHTKFKRRGHFGCFSIIGSLFVIGVLSLILGYPVMMLWNWIAVGLFGAVVITYWQGVGLFLLAHLLVGSIIPSRSFMRFHHPHCDDDGSWRKHGWGRWRYYDEYWKSEGKQAFEEFVKRREEEKGKKEND
jgi:hypothetical protein